ncbi:MAG: sensor histidine kinase [Granulosicoccaceae bacterium]
MHANLNVKAAFGSAKLRNSKLHFYFICVVLVLSTIAAAVYANRTEAHRESLLTSREALRLHELFQNRLTLYQAAVNEVADVLHFDAIPGESEFSRVTYRLLVQNPLLFSLGWVLDHSQPEPRRISSLYDNSSRDLRSIWRSPEWAETLKYAQSIEREFASKPMRVSINGEEQFVLAYMVPVNSELYEDIGFPEINGFAFGIIQLQKVFVQSIASSLDIKAKIELIDHKPLREGGGSSILSVIGLDNPKSTLSEGHEAFAHFDWGNRNLELKLIPSEDFLASNRSYVPWLVLAMGSVLLALMMRLFGLLEKMAATQREELTRREQEMERKHSETSVLLDVAPVAILMLNSAGVIVAQSRNSITLRREISVGKKFEDLAVEGAFRSLDGDPIAIRDNPALRALRGERIINLQLRRRLEGRECYFAFSASPICSPQGEITGSVCVSSDVTDLVQAIESQKLVNSQLSSSNLRLQQFASVASHDLQEPLRKITTFASLLEMDLAEQLSGEPKQYLDYMVDGAKRMSDLIRDILQYSEITPGTEELSCVDLAEAVQSSLLELSESIQSSGAQVILKNSLAIFTSERMLPRLIGNLISNSIKYRSEFTPRIEIEATRQGDGVLVSFSDNGMGIAEEYREQVFNMFKRLHGNGKITGTGIGLSICKQIVELNGGRIWIEDNPEGGSRFMLFFPSMGEAIAA